VSENTGGASCPDFAELEPPSLLGDPSPSEEASDGFERLSAQGLPRPGRRTKKRKAEKCAAAELPEEVAGPESPPRPAQKRKKKKKSCEEKEKSGMEEASPEAEVAGTPSSAIEPASKSSKKDGEEGSERKKKKSVKRTRKESKERKDVSGVVVRESTTKRHTKKKSAADNLKVESGDKKKLLLQQLELNSEVEKKRKSAKSPDMVDRSEALENDAGLKKLSANAGV